MTHPIDALTPEEVHKAVLERIGWTNVRLTYANEFRGMTPNKMFNEFCPPLDDNLMREARKLLDTVELKASYIINLIETVDSLTGPYRLIDSSPLEQACAFLKTLEGRE